MDRILNGLNEQQRCAVTSTAPVLQVLAPPGSGKTKTLTTRVAFLIDQLQLKPWNIIVCTFTIKAAREMRDRIKGFIGEQLQSKLVLGTFHSISLRYLKVYGKHIGIPPNFTVADSNDTLAILKRLIKRHAFQIEPNKARSRISKKKAKLEDTAQNAKGPMKIEAQEFQQLYDLYQQTLRSSALLDYDDLLLCCVQLLQQHPECASNIDAVLVDEFQDTNNVQYLLMTLFAQHRNTDKRPPSITIVGDPDQSIYSFRSAETGNVNKMRVQYADTHIVNLEDNYRSAGAILQYAMRVIEQDETRELKKMKSTLGYGTVPVLRELENSKQEAVWIVREIKRLTALTCSMLTYADFSILLRSTALSRLIETELGAGGVPYRMIGGHKFFDRKEVKLLLDYMRVIAQPNHSDALLRIINEPPRRIGDATIKQLIETAEINRVPLWSLVTKLARNECPMNVKISSSAQDGLAKFFNIITRGQQKLKSLRSGTDSLVQLLNFIEQAIGLDAYLAKETKDKESIANRRENVDELKAQAGTVIIDTEEMIEDDALLSIPGIEQDRPTGPEAALSKFLANVALATDAQAAGDPASQNVVTVSTIHAAKGLEWPVVFIPSVYHGSIPHSRSEDDDEERRLLYVGMTRAQALLYLSWGLEKSDGENHILSNFLKEGSINKDFRRSGPSFDAAKSIHDLAAILRRQSPSVEDIDQCRNSIEHPYDTLIVLEKSQTLTAERRVEAYGDRTNGVKRRRTDGAMGEAKHYTTLVTSSYQAAASGMGHANVNSGCVTYSGFTTAGSINQHLEEIRSSMHDNEEKKTTKVSKKSKGHRSSVSQGTISSFFAKHEAQTIRHNERLHQQTTVGLKRASTFEGFRNDLKENAPAKNENLQDDANSVVFRAQQMAQPIPQTFVRNIRRGKTVQNMQTCHEELEPGYSNTKTILLSSSPAKPMNEVPPSRINRQPNLPEQLHKTEVTDTNAVMPLFKTISNPRLNPSNGPKRLGMGKPRSWAEIQASKKKSI